MRKTFYSLKFKSQCERLLEISCRKPELLLTAYRMPFIIIIIDNRGLNARWCLTPFLLSLPTAAYLGQRWAAIVRMASDTNGH